jgi:DNA-binding NarL/FixJ family response regulator
MVGRSQNTDTVIVGERALFREGVVALPRHASYKITASAKWYSELKDVRPSTGWRILVILGVDSDDNISECCESIKILRTLFPGSAIVLIAEARRPANLQQILVVAPDGYVVNLTSCDVPLKLLGVVLLDQQVIVLPQQKSTSAVTGLSDSAKRTNSGDGNASNNQRFPAAPSLGIEDPQLSQREHQILTRLAEGDRNKQIARAFIITESTFPLIFCCKAQNFLNFKSLATAAASNNRSHLMASSRKSFSPSAVPWEA